MTTQKLLVRFLRPFFNTSHAVHRRFNTPQARGGAEPRGATIEAENGCRENMGHKCTTSDLNTHNILYFHDVLKITIIDTDRGTADPVSLKLPNILIISSLNCQLRCSTFSAIRRFNTLYHSRYNPTFNLALILLNYTYYM